MADLPSCDYLDGLVDTDPLRLRDVAFALRRRVEKAEASLARAREANRRLTAKLIASAHLLDIPYSNAPELTPWSRSIKPAMADLRAALDVPADGEQPPTPALDQPADEHTPGGTDHA